MIPFYKTLRLSALALSLILACGGARAEQDRLFTVGGVRVDVSAANATKARDEAFLKAQQEAFSKIAAERLPPARLAAFKPPEPATIGPMIKDFEVSNEKITPTRYIGTYTFRFYAPAVAGWLGESSAQDGGAIDAGARTAQAAVSGAPSVTSQGGETISIQTSHVPAAVEEIPAGPPMLVLPFYQWGSRTILWTDTNPWRERWSVLGPAGGGVIVPRGDLEDVKGVADTQALTYDPAAVAAMKQRYGAAHAFVLIGAPKLPSGMDVYIYDADGPEPVYLHTLTVQAGPAQDVLELAARQAAAFMRTARTERPLAVVASDSTVRTLHLRVLFSTPQEWIETQRALAAVEGVKSTEIASLSSNEAMMLVTLRGDDAAVTALMAAQGLALSADGAGGSLYDLCLRSYCSGQRGAFLP